MAVEIASLLGCPIRRQGQLSSADRYLAPACRMPAEQRESGEGHHLKRFGRYTVLADRNVGP